MMSTETPDDLPAPAPGDGEEEDRYAAIELADGGVVIYDSENHRAWIQSDDATAIAAMA